MPIVVVFWSLFFLGQTAAASGYYGIETLYHIYMQTKNLNVSFLVPGVLEVKINHHNNTVVLCREAHSPFLLTHTTSIDNNNNNNNNNKITIKKQLADFFSFLLLANIVCLGYSQNSFSWLH